MENSAVTAHLLSIGHNRATILQETQTRLHFRMVLVREGAELEISLQVHINAFHEVRSVQPVVEHVVLYRVHEIVYFLVTLADELFGKNLLLVLRLRVIVMFGQYCAHYRIAVFRSSNNHNLVASWRMEITYSSKGELTLLR